MNNIQLYNLAKSYLGQGGSTFRKYCGLGSGAPYCNAFVTYIFHKGGDALLYCGGKKMTYCPTSIKWCYNNLAQIPIYLAMPMDVIYFDWELNGTPNHIGFVRQRKSDVEVYTIEGNTSGGIVANKVRVAKYVQAVFRPHFQATFDTSKPLTIDGQFDYSSVAMLQKALGVKVDGILGKDTVKMLQKVAGVTQDGSWGKNTSKAVQKMVGVKVDGAWGVESTKALQKWINSKVKPQPTPKPTPQPTPSGKLVIDGHGGPATVKAMQKFFGTTQDGVISGQNRDLKKYYSSLESVEFGKGGSACIRNLQRWVGANEDGILGQITVKLWQKKIGTQQNGYFGTESMKKWQTYLNEHDKAVYPPTPTETIVDKELGACKVQADWMKNYTYKWQNNPTIAKSKTYGTCVTYVACVLQRIGVLKSGQYIWHDGKGRVDGANNKMSVSYPNGTLKSLKSKLKAGDIVMIGDKSSTGAGGNSHICILSGKWDASGNPYVWDNQSASRVKKGSNGLHTYGGGHKIIALIRLK